MKNLFKSVYLAPFFFSFSNSAIINIPTDHLTIQAGINAATEGDTVLVANGTYLENINYNGKAITVASHFIIDGDDNHISNTIINGGQPSDPDRGSVVSFVSGEDTTSVLNGFTVTGGEGSYSPSWYEAFVGGGIYILGGAKIMNNHIINNSVYRKSGNINGGGIFIYAGSSNMIFKRGVYVRKFLKD